MTQLGQHRSIKTRLHRQSFVARRRLVNGEKIRIYREDTGTVFTFLVQMRRSTVAPEVTASGSTILSLSVTLIFPPQPSTLFSIKEPIPKEVYKSDYLEPWVHMKSHTRSSTTAQSFRRIFGRSSG